MVFLKQIGQPWSGQVHHHVKIQRQGKNFESSKRKMTHYIQGKPH